MAGFRTLPASFGPVIHCNSQTLDVESLRNGSASRQLINERHDRAACPRHGFVPIRKLQTLATLLEYDSGQPIGHGTSKQCGWNATAQILVGWYGKAKLHYTTVGRRIATIDTPTRESAQVLIAL